MYTNSHTHTRTAHREHKTNGDGAIYRQQFALVPVSQRTISAWNGISCHFNRGADGAQFNWKWMAERWKARAQLYSRCLENLFSARYSPYEIEWAVVVVDVQFLFYFFSLFFWRRMKNTYNTPRSLVHVHHSPFVCNYDKQKHKKPFTVMHSLAVHFFCSLFICVRLDNRRITWPTWLIFRFSATMKLIQNEKIDRDTVPTAICSCELEILFIFSIFTGWLWRVLASSFPKIIYESSGSNDANENFALLNALVLYSIYLLFLRKQNLTNWNWKFYCSWNRRPCKLSF